MTVWLNVIGGIIGWEIGKAMFSFFQKYRLTIQQYPKLGYDETHYIARKVFGIQIKKRVRRDINVLL